MSLFPKVSIEERARRYLAAMEAPRRAPDDPQYSHTVVFNATRALIHGFGFTPGEAQPFLEEYLQRSDLPWTPGEVVHKLRSVQATPSKWPAGYLRRENDWKPSTRERRDFGIPTEQEVRKKIDFQLEKLLRIAAPWRDKVDLLWLANRSAADPATLTAAGFLKLMYGPAEKVLCFTNEYSQGEALWPDQAPPAEGKCGVWFLPQPVTGEYVANPEGRPGKDGGPPPPSRRIGRCVTAWRYMVIESDLAPMKDWLGFIVQAPLQIEALYTSGSRSIHALVRVDAKTYDDWHVKKNELMPFLMACIMVGADKGVSTTGVRLSRLPGCLRHGKMIERKDAKTGGVLTDGNGRTLKQWVKYPGGPGVQKLLYVRPRAEVRPLTEVAPERDVEAHWLRKFEQWRDGYGAEQRDELAAALRYYANVSERCAEALRELEAAR